MKKMIFFLFVFVFALSVSTSAGESDEKVYFSLGGGAGLSDEKGDVGVGVGVGLNPAGSTAGIVPLSLGDGWSVGAGLGYRWALGEEDSDFGVTLGTGVVHSLSSSTSRDTSFVVGIVFGWTPCSSSDHSNWGFGLGTGYSGREGSSSPGGGVRPPTVITK